MSIAFSSLDEAAKALLLSTCEVLDGNVEYVIAGGWVPILRTTMEGLSHPGTRDVDVLFNDERNHIRNAVAHLLEEGFTPSAKHEFQLLRRATVAKRDFIFNVDLMHPSEQRHSPDLFEDIFDLGVSDAYDATGKRWAKSIVFPSAQIVFEQNLWSSIDVMGRNLAGQEVTQRVSLLGEDGFILSKAESVQNIKRTRDSFDIYFVMCGNNGWATSASLRRLAGKFPSVQAQIEKLKKWIADQPGTFEQRVNHHAGKVRIDNAAQMVIDRL